MRIRNFHIANIVFFPLVLLGGLYFIIGLNLFFFSNTGPSLDSKILISLVILVFAIPIDKFKVWIVVVLLIVAAILRFPHFALAMGICLVIYSLKTYTLLFLESLSVIYIDEQGITRKHLYRKRIFIAWEEFNYIGVGEEIAPYTGDFHFLLYFSKIRPQKVHYHMADVLRQTQGHFFIEYKEGLLEEVLKYASEERIADVERIKNSEKPWSSQKPSLSTYKREKIIKKLIERWRAK